MAIATGDVEDTGDETISGPPVSRAAALVAVAHGGQVLLASDAHEALTSSGVPGFSARGLGPHSIRGMHEGELVFQLDVEGETVEFPALRVDELPPPLPISERGVVGYELRDEIGAGPSGVVHRAYQPSIGREVAIKIVKPEFANEVSFIRRFEVETRLVARLEHPNIVPVHDFWREPDGAYLVMRWLRGGSLAGRLDSGPLSTDELDRLVHSLGPALEYAHRRGVAHGDIKASNVLLDEEGNYHLSDFGAGRAVDLRGDWTARDVAQLAQLIDRCAGDKTRIEDLLDAATTEPGFESAASLVEAWVAATGVSADSRVTFTRTRNPYKGLLAFGELDAGRLLRSGRGDQPAGRGAGSEELRGRGRTVGSGEVVGGPSRAVAGGQVRGDRGVGSMAGDRHAAGPLSPRGAGVGADEGRL